MKNIFIYAYTQTNLGDDLFVKMLCDRYPHHKFHIMCRKSQSNAFFKIPNLNIITSDLFLRRAINKINHFPLISNYLFKKYDAFVIIGGSLFIEPLDWEKHISETQKKMSVNKPFYILGSNFGPFSNKEFYEGYKKTFYSATDICFRDQYSFELFSGLKNVRLAPDVVFSFDRSTIKEHQEDREIVFSVINLEGRKNISEYLNEYELKMAETASLLLEEGYKVNLVSFCEDEGDTKAVIRIKSHISGEYKDNLSTHIYKGDLEETMRILKSAKGIVGTRFHSIVLGLVFNINIYPVIYSEKTNNMLKDIGFRGNSSWLQEIKDVKASTIVEQVVGKNVLDISKQKELAQKQFLGLDIYLK